MDEWRVGWVNGQQEDKKVRGCVWRRGPPVDSERAIAMAGSFSQQDASGLAWCSKDAKKDMK